MSHSAWIRHFTVCRLGGGEGPPSRGDVDDLLPHVAHGLAQPVGVAAADHDGGDLARRLVLRGGEVVPGDRGGGINIPLKENIEPFKKGFVKGGLRFSRHGREGFWQVRFTWQLRNFVIFRKNQFVGGGGGTKSIPLAETQDFFPKLMHGFVHGGQSCSP